MARLLNAALAFALCVAFAAAVCPGSAPWRFAVLNDSRAERTAATADTSYVNAAILALIARQVVRDSVELVIFGGDMIQGWMIRGTLAYGDRFAEWRRVMAPIYDAGIPVYPVRGNQEDVFEPPLPWPPQYPYQPPAADTEALGAYRAAFAADSWIPRNGPTGEIGLTYSFAHRNAFFIGLDNYRSPHRVNQAWFERELRRSRHASHLFVFGHEPAFRVENTRCLAYFPEERDRFWEALGRAGGRVYFCGHDHFYNRARIQDRRGRAIEQVLLGSSGAPLEPWHPPYPEGARVLPCFHDERDTGYLLVTITGPRALIEYRVLRPTNEGVRWETADSLVVAAGRSK